MNRIEKYSLSGSTLPTMPVPHDCIVKEIRVEGHDLVFVFEDDISYHDGITQSRPGVKSLVIRYHLADDLADVGLFVRTRPNRILHKPGVYRQIDLTKDPSGLTRLCAHPLEYLYHNVGYCSIIIKLWSAGSIILDMTVDSVEYQWISDKK